MKFTKLIFTIVLFAYSCSSIASQPQEPKWLTISNFEHSPNQWYNLRKEVVLNDVPEKTTVKIAADSKYWLWINGKLAIYEGMVKRGPNPEDTYYDEVDIAKYLQKGKNTIAVLVWYFGREGFSHKDSKKFGFFFDGKIGGQQIISDASWKIIRNKSYQNIKEGKPSNYRLPESNVNFVSYKANSGWQQSNFDDSSWEFAIESGTEGVAPWNNLVKREIPQWKDFGLTKVADLERNGNRVIMKLPYNMQFSYWFKIKAKQGDVVNITSDSFEWLNDTPIRAKYVAKEGIQEYEHFPWMSGHEIYFDLDPGVELIEAGYRETGYNSEMDGKFVIDDPYMMRFLQKANRTLYVNMRDTFFDCPDRERAQWWGDLVLLMEESFYVLDNNAHALSRKAIRELVDWQKDNGTLFSPIPAGNWDKELPQQMLASIALGFSNYYKYTGDIETYTYVFPHVKKYLDLWTVDSNGHVNFKDGGWNWSDWGEQVDSELLEQAWYYMALQTYADISEKVGDLIEQQKALETAARIKKFVNNNYWTNQGYKSTNYKKEIDDRGNAMMVVSGIATVDKHKAISSLLKNIRHSSPYMDKYALEALFIMGKSEQALARIKTRYKAMVDSDLSTLWELFDYGNWSYNHGWSGGPLSMMYKYMAGIQPTKAGFEQFQIFPTPINYKNIDCSFSTIKGKIALKYLASEKNKTMEISVPKESEAIIRVPVNAESLELEGEGKYLLLEDRKDDKYNYYSLSSGQWIVKFSTLL